MTLQQLLAPLAIRSSTGDCSVEVKRVLCDSRKVSDGDVFVAVHNHYYNGHDYIQSALDAGAAAIIHSEDLPDGLETSAPCVRIHNTMDALGMLCAFNSGEPSRSMRLIGVTGTNGKTTTCHMIESILQAANVPTGHVGTTGARFGETEIDTGLTTPEAPELQDLLAKMVEGGVQSAAIEVSSHGIALGRVSACHFAVGVFTGMGRDHLDFHGSQEEYQETKVNWLLDDVQQSAGLCGAVVPFDDEAGQEVYREFRGRILSFGFDDDADIYPDELELTATGTRGRVVTPYGTLSLFLNVAGRHNVRNALAAIGVAHLLDIEAIAVVEGLQRFQGVTGRFHSVPNDRGLQIYVDYAHTPDALRAAVQSLNEVTDKNVVVVFGCGGDRDASKRPEMGAVAAEFANTLVVTSDNPRSEDPDSIIKDIVSGIPESFDASSVVVEVDRAKAIAQALSLAKEGDAVLIAGKGHETKQIIGDQVLPFDDRLVVEEALSL